MKKKLMALVLLCTMLAALTACGGKKKDGTLTYTMPEGFTEQSEGQWVSTDYPNDSSNIMVQASENDPYGVDYTEEQFIELVTTAYAAQGYSVEDFTIVEFNKSKINGYDTLLIDCEYSLMGVELQQIEFLAQIGDTTHVITYTTSPIYGWYDAFRTSAEGITIE